MIELSVVMPCYEEAENLKLLLPKISASLAGISPFTEILVVDTQTPHDDTPKICAQFSGVKYVPRHGGDTYGDAVRTGIAQSSGKYVVFMDADGSHNPADIPALYGEITASGADIVIGSRYMKGGESDNSFILRSMSIALNYCYRLVLGLDVYDVSDSFRIYDGGKLRAIAIRCSNFDVIEEILINLRRKFNDLKIKEIPIAFTKRLHGKSKRKWVRFIISYILTLFRLKKLQHKEGV